MDTMLNLLQIPEVAKILRISERTVRSLVATGELPVVRVRRRVLVAEADLTKYIDGLRAGAQKGKN